MQVIPSLIMGGVERGTVEIAAALQKAGIRNLVVSAGGRMVADLERLGVEHITLPVASKNPFVIWRNVYRLASLVREKGVTLMHVRSRAPAWSVLGASRKTGVPFLATYHGVYGTHPAFLKKPYNAVMTKGVKVIAVSDFVKRHLLQEYGVPESRIVRIYRGADTSVFSPERVTPERAKTVRAAYGIAPETPVLTLVGRLTRLKGHTLLLDAFLKMKHQNLACLFVGSDQGRTEYTQELQRRIAQLPKGFSVQIVQTSPNMPETYAISDIVVNPSLVPEAFGRVVPEAQAMGRLVVGAAHGGACETIQDGKTGFLFTPGDADSLAAKLDAALDLPCSERNKICSAALESVRANFSIRRMCEETLALYRDIQE